MRFLAAFLAVASLASAQGYRKHNLTVNGLAGLPRGDLREVFSPSGGIGGHYGYRFHPYFQLEAGYETLFGAARIRDFVPTAFGSLRIRDYQQFLPFGGRVIVPLKGDRVQLHAGVGGAYFRYSERIRQPFRNSGFTFDCPECALRDGVGYYGLVGANFALDAAQNFRLGFGSRLYRGATSGDPLGGVPGRETADRWISIYGSFGFSF